ncbi:ABC-2 type transport system ATP-binding protein [Thermoactinomyces sp. DSM 45891]|uniref:ABC-2 type transport system ATP-binding protein n=1 Tax=Baia soyae TaxID=1544746 RepID=A0A4R2RZR6_9BACL|nr:MULTISPECIES: ATP-binding cassette domain-containing protein [Thermoactinomycetaceae]TCP69108.1 ABC-2 type transport system ATP-binding protein [Baia soyae]SFW99778.1 ABC-2 type transport system ATP-binding protein [Thermoactinomyces sp. DSM 45891]
MSTRDILISTYGLTKKFDSFTAVNEVDLDIYEGEVLGLLGPNGAGKTTLISMLTTVLPPDGGSATVCGYDLLKDSSKVKQKVSLVPQDLALYLTLTAEENLSFFANLYGLKGREKRSRIKEVLKIAQLEDWANRKVGAYSGGMKRRLNLAIGLLNRPKVLFLDEPTVGVDPQSRNHIFNSIQYLVKEFQMTVIYTTHYMEEAQELCDRVAIYDKGKILDLEETDTLLQKYGDKQLVLDFKSIPDWLVQHISSLPHVDSHHVIDNKLTIHSSNLLEVTENVLGWLRTNQIPVESFNVHESDLESVFLKLTGKKLRD